MSFFLGVIPPMLFMVVQIPCGIQMWTLVRQSVSGHDTACSTIDMGLATARMTNVTTSVLVLYTNISYLVFSFIRGHHTKVIHQKIHEFHHLFASLISEIV